MSLVLVVRMDIVIGIRALLCFLFGMFLYVVMYVWFGICPMLLVFRYCIVMTLTIGTCLALLSSTGMLSHIMCRLAQLLILGF